jgi:ABC-type uncharacterized transport system ATPase subunit
MKYDYSSIGFYTFDCLGWPFTAVPPGGGCYFIDELTLAVSGAAGTAAIAAAKMGLHTLAVGGVGNDLMGDWVLQRLRHFGVDVSAMQQIKGAKTSSSIVTTRADGTRPALHMKGATGDFYVDDELMTQVIDARIVHIGGIGLMDSAKMAEHAVKSLTNIDLRSRSPETTVEELSGGQRQGVAIARAMYFKSKVLILDEPTNHLSVKETNKVLDFVVALRDQGITSIFISHNLHHIYPIADRIVAMARGEKIADLRKADTSIEGLTDLIV